VDKKKLERLWGFLFAAISFIVGVAGLSTMDKRVIIGVLILCGVLAALSAMYFLRSSKNPAFKQLAGGIPDSEDLVVRTARNEAEIRIVSELDHEYFGEESVDFAGLLSWWKRYPQGVFILVKGAEVLGAVGIWPITKRAYQALTNGDLDDSEIRSRDIGRTSASKPHAYWYFADIVLGKKYKRKKLVFVLLEEALMKWLKDGNVAVQVDMCAIGVGEEGAPILRKFGFISHIKSKREHPIFVRTATLIEIRQDLDEKISKPRRRARI
jgi:hypothetical protein